jgi:hypothetical protein
MSQLGLWRLGPANGRHRHTNQYLGQIEVPVLKALAASRWRRASKVSTSAMARDMNTAPDFIRDQKIGSFARPFRCTFP